MRRFSGCNVCVMGGGESYGGSERSYGHEVVRAYENEDYEPGPVWDRFGNPTRDTFAARYESIHDIGDKMTLEEFFKEMRQLYEETGA